MSPLGYNLAHAVLWQAAWFAAVLAAAHGHLWLGALSAAPVLLLHAWRHRARPDAGLALPAIAVAVGAVVDGLCGLAGLSPAGGWPSPWMLGLWAVFGTALDASLAWLRGRPWLAAACGAVGGPVAYWGGMRLGAVAPAGWEVLAAVALGWAVAVPALDALSSPRWRRPAHA